MTTSDFNTLPAWIRRERRIEAAIEREEAEAARKAREAAEDAREEARHARNREAYEADRKARGLGVATSPLDLVMDREAFDRIMSRP